MEWFALAARDMKIQTRQGENACRVTASEVWVEACENYQKQSWRNRFRFLGASGPESLSIPVVHEGGGEGMPVRRVRVDWSGGWPLRHKRAITSAYSSSPFFEYYKDGLFEVLDSRPEYLFDYNLQIIRFLSEKLGIAATFRPTEEFAPAGSCKDDFRETIHPKRGNTVLRDLNLEKPYFQVFSGKYGFTGNVSVIDLLFNEGPDAVFWLYKV